MIPVLIAMGLMLMAASAAERPAPGVLTTSEIEGFEDFDPARQKLVRLALEEVARLKLKQYVFGSAEPEQGGFDCSGAVFHLLKKGGLNPARSSAAQFDWIGREGMMHDVPEDVTSLEDESFAELKPGDLLFWAGTYTPTDGRKNKITHVQMFLGREKDGGPVMVGSSDGRSYRGEARCGFGVFDFKLPRKGSKARFVGYGTPPGLLEEDED